MNLVDGATTFPVLVGNNASLARSEDTARHMEAVGRGDLAAVLVRNLAMTRSLCGGCTPTRAPCLGSLEL